LVFVSGALPFDPAGKIDYTTQGCQRQTKRVIDNIALALAAAKLTLDDVVYRHRLFPRRPTTFRR